MGVVPVVVKHQGKRYDVDCDTDSPGETFKIQVYSLTGVEPERQKILVKGGQLKDDTDMSKLGLKAGHALMMMGTPSGDGSSKIEAPKQKMKFVEDMTEAEAAQQEGAVPAGLVNLGNSCYMNSTLQTLKSIPELQQALSQYKSDNNGGLNSAAASSLSQLGLGSLDTSDLTASLRDLFGQMSQTQEAFSPVIFLTSLRKVFPQFGQRSRDGHGYAQQDAEEAWSQIVSQLKQKLKFEEQGGQDAPKDVAFVDKYISGAFDIVMECDEASARDAGEEAVKGSDVFFKLNCHIAEDTNHLRDGLTAGLSEKIEKTSSVLGRDAIYTKTSRISRLPKYLPVHFMRFGWRKTTNKKAKILRKVTFPHELDILEFCNDDLKKSLIPIRDKIREIRKDEEDIERARKRQKRIRKGEENDTVTEPTKEDDKNKTAPKDGGNKNAKGGASKDAEMPDVTYKTDAEIEAEKDAAILTAKKEIQKLVDESSLLQDDSVNNTGLYELRGVITHQGISADSGHYTSFVKKTGHVDPTTGKPKEEDGKWWWFNDEKVTEVGSEKIDSLVGGGQAHSALMLLYRAVPLPKVESKQQADSMDTSS